MTKSNFKYVSSNPINKKEGALSAREQQILESINWNARMERIWDIYLRREYVFDDIYLVTYGYRTILISQLCGGVFRYDNKKYRLIIEGKKIKLQKIKQPNNERIIYENGTFYPTEGDWLMQSCQARSRNRGYKCFTIYKNGDFEKIIIADHQLQALFKYGAFALTTLGNGGNPNCVNHKDGDKYNNKSENLEVISHKMNARHYHDEIKHQPPFVSKDVEAILNPKIF
ncbi:MULTISPECIES: HNH endonuclease [Lysinibacillus]|uniref:HNH endonuclease n=1 Tax=Lysinibacillus TaxID=400634 RepID=UPI00084B739D|nr:HNH endonuclease [Lysinibacillus sphaericus]OEB99792.1 hypothetical protein GY31_22060 [Lysinibacillus sphaericus]